ncbi:MAG: hypothetical protein ACJASL_002163 [Paraglaciecola sp.]|jgi:hypothetical protein
MNCINDAFVSNDKHVALIEYLGGGLFLSLLPFQNLPFFRATKHLARD